MDKNRKYYISVTAGDNTIAETFSTLLYVLLAARKALKSGMSVKIELLQKDDL